MRETDIIILGGGPAGLAAAFYAQKKGLDYLLVEANEETGGNCRTIKHGDFYFDTGAHRFHDKDKEITQEIKHLMGDDLVEVIAPSQIYYQGKMIDFPLSPYDLLKKLPTHQFFIAALQLMKNSLLNSGQSNNFEHFAIATYGNFIARNFLLNYSEKLWGLPCRNLSKNIAGKRLKGLDLRTFLIEGIFGKVAKTKHLDGAFFYPQKGFGDIMKRMESTLNAERVLKNSRVTSLVSEKDSIVKIVINGKEEIEARHIINTLPLTLTLNLFNEKPPYDIAEVALSLKYRHIVLAVFVLAKQNFTTNASIYFPEKEIPFTRIYEPKNRSKRLAPADKTCIVVEIPCKMEDPYWKMNEQELKKSVEAQMGSLSMITSSEVLDFVSFKVPFAYPILETGFEQKAKRIIDYLGKYTNMHLSGRSALFSYSHLHDQMKMGKEIIEKLS